jgi:hypothetical protein
MMRHAAACVGIDDGGDGDALSRSDGEASSVPLLCCMFCSNKINARTGQRALASTTAAANTTAATAMP